MEIIYWYFLFAITTATVSAYHFFIPILNAISKTHSELNVVEYKYLTILILFLLTILLAPLMFLISIVPTLGMEFKIKLQEVLCLPD